VVFRKLIGLICAAILWTACQDNTPVEIVERVKQTPAISVYSDIPLRAESENFVALGYIESEFATRFLQDMEVFRTVLFDLNGVENTGQYAKPEFLFFENVNIYDAFRVGHHSVAHYARFDNGATFVIRPPMKGAGLRDLEDTLFHEYVHHFNAYHLGYKPPTWINEGSAEYFATFKKTDAGDYAFGHKDKNRFRHLKSAKAWLSFESIFSDLLGYPLNRGMDTQTQRHLFYSQSWLLYHWMRTTDAGRAAEEKLRASVNEGVGAAAAFPENIEAILKEFLSESNFAPQTIAIPDIQSEITIAPISDNDMAGRSYLQLALDRGAGMKKDVMASLANIIANDPDQTKYLRLVEGVKLCRAGDFVDGEAALKEALESGEDQNDYGVVRTVALNYIRCWYVSQEHMSEALDIIEGAKRFAPTDPDLDLEFLISINRYGVKGREKPMLQNILDTDHHKRRVFRAVGLVEVLLTLEAYDEAERVVKRAAQWNDDDKDYDKRLSELLLRVQAFQKAAQED